MFCSGIILYWSHRHHRISVSVRTPVNWRLPRQIENASLSDKISRTNLHSPQPKLKLVGFALFSSTHSVAAKAKISYPKYWEQLSNSVGLDCGPNCHCRQNPQLQPYLLKGLHLPYSLSHCGFKPTPSLNFCLFL